LYQYYQYYTCTLFLAPEGTYKNGLRGVFAEIMRESGPKGLFKGLSPVLVRAFPANAVSDFLPQYQF